MDTALVKQFLDSCHNAKRITELMPKLPKGMTPRHIHVIDAIVLTEQQKGKVQVSDISRHLNVTMPSVTRLVRELEEQGVLVKYPDREDGRNVLLKLTALGQEYYQRYVHVYYQELGQRLEEISRADLKTAVQTINKVYGCMKEK